MDLSVFASRLAGNPGPLGWIQVYEHTPPDENLLKTKGKLFALVHLDFESEELSHFSEGREILSKLQSEYYEKDNLGAFEALKLALEKVRTEYQIEGRKINIATASFVNGVLFTAVTGNVQAGVVRDGASVKILLGKTDGVVSASGYPKEKDIFVLGTNIFFATFSDNEIKNAFTENLSEQIPERFETKILSSQDLFGVGVIALRFGQESEPKSLIEEKPAFLETPRKVGFISGVLNKINARLPKRKLTIRSETEPYEDVSERKKLSNLGVLLLLILIVSITFGVRQNRIKTEKGKYMDDLLKAQHSFEEAVNVSSLDKERSRQLILEAKALTVSLTEKKIKNEDLEKLIAAIKEKEGALLGEYQIEPQLYMDLSLISDNFSSRDTTFSDTEVVFLDKGGKKAITLNTETKRAEAVSGMDKVGNGKRVGIYAKIVYVLNDDGVVEVGGKEERIVEKEWGEDVFLRAYSGNLYVFDRSNSTVYRYPGLTSGFASKQLWLAPGIKPDFSDMVSWVIDGSIWVGYKDGTIQKYTQGSPKNVEVRGIDFPLKEVKSIYSNGDINDVYLLDSQNSRIVVMDKDGNYLCQYKADALSEATDLFVNEGKKQAVFLTGGNKLYSIDLKHL